MTSSKTKVSKDQKLRFEEMARELECDESDDALERVFDGLNPKKRPEPKKPSTSKK